MHSQRNHDIHLDRVRIGFLKELFLRLLNQLFGITFVLSICKSLADDRFHLDLTDDLDESLCIERNIFLFKEEETKTISNIETYCLKFFGAPHSDATITLNFG